MFRIFRSLYYAKGAKPNLVVACLLIAGVFQGIGLTSMLPVLAAASDQGQDEENKATRVVQAIFDFFSWDFTLGALLVFAISCIVLKCAMHFLAMRFVGYAVAEVSTQLRYSLIENLMNARWAFFAEHASGRIANAISTEATRASNCFAKAASTTSYAIQAVIYAIVAFLVSWEVAVFALIIGGIVGFGLTTFVVMVRKAGRRQTIRTNDLTSSLVSTLTAIKPLKAMNRQDRFASFFNRTIHRLRNALRKQVVGVYALKNSQEATITIIVGAGYYTTATYWNLPMSEVLMLGFLLYQTVYTIGKAQQEFQTTQQDESAYTALMELIDDAEAAAEPNPGKTQAKFEKSCRLESVFFSHGERQILRDISLELPTSGITVLVGPSGAGKTTIADIILGLRRPEEGRVYLDGQDLQKIDLVSWRKMIGYVPQELALFFDSILINVTLGAPDLTEEDAIEALKTAQAWDFVKDLPEGLHTVVGEQGIKLSGGQRQRIALARALAHRPKLLILDEVTSALDPDTEAEICQSIASLRHDLSILAITHRESWTEISDRVYHVDAGQVREVEDPKGCKPSKSNLG